MQQSSTGLVVAGALLCGAAALGTQPVAAQPSDPDRAAALQALPRVSDLPPEFRYAPELADRGVFLVGGGLAFRRDDGGEHHGFDALRHWASDEKDDPTQGAVYKIEDGSVVAAGYLVRQADLVAGGSFRHLSLRELDFPAPQYLSVEFREAESTEANRYLWLWHFLPLAGSASPTVPAGTLPPVTSLPPRFTLFACAEYPNDFCPQMGRHFTDGSASATRAPATTGDDGVIYGEVEGPARLHRVRLPAAGPRRRGLLARAAPEQRADSAARQPAPAALRQPGRAAGDLHGAHVLHSREDLSRLGRRSGTAVGLRLTVARRPAPPRALRPACWACCSCPRGRRTRTAERRCAAWESRPSTGAATTRDRSP